MSLLIVSKSFVVKNALEMYFKNNTNINSIICVSDIYDIHKDLLSDIDIIFIEINSYNTFDDIIKLKNNYSDIKVIMLDSENKNTEKLSKALTNGIEGYITNLHDEEEFNILVKKVFSSDKYYDMDLLLKHTLSSNTKATHCSYKKNLTSREQDILELVSLGYSNNDIATKLYLSQNTIKKHVTNILDKLDLNNRKELILFYKNEIEA